MSTHKQHIGQETHRSTHTQLTPTTHSSLARPTTQTQRIPPPTASTDNSHREHTHVPHINRAHPSGRADTAALHTNTHGDSRTRPERPQPQHSPGRTPPLPADPGTNSEPDTRTHPGETPADPQPRTRALPRRDQTPPCAVTAPQPRRRHVRPPRPPGERGANNRLLLGRSPRPQEPQTPRPQAAPCRRPQRVRARGVAAPPFRTPTSTPPGLRTAGDGAVGVDSLPRGRTDRQGALSSPHPIVCKQTRQTA